MPATIDDFYAFEQNFEPAVAAILKAAGFKVTSPFVAVNPTATAPEMAALVDGDCWVQFEVAETDEQIRAFRADADFDGGQISEPAGFDGTIEITHRIKVDDTLQLTGVYAALCQQRGQIRALFRESKRPFKDSLPLYDILSIRLVGPDRRVDGERLVNQATERFRVRFTAAGTGFPAE